MTQFQILILGFIFICSSAFAQSNDTINRVDQNGWKQGFWKKESPDGKTMYEGTFLNNKPIGEFKRYDQDGKIKTQMLYHSDGKIEVVFFDKQGKTLSTGAFLNTEKEGEWKFYSNSYIIKSETYRNGLKNGESITFDENGKTISKTPYIDDTITGIVFEYYNTGKPKWESSYVKGKKSGRSATYYPNQMLESEGKYIDDSKDGFWNFYNEMGLLKYSIEYKNGVIQNPKVIDSIDQLEFQRLEENRYNIKDPQNYINNPEDFFKK